MSIQELKHRLSTAKKAAGEIPQNFWWALLQVATELQVDSSIHKLQELREILQDYSIPAALRRILYKRHYHPGCAEDLKIRAQYELYLVELVDEVQEMHEELYRMVELECPYTFWAVANTVLNENEIRFTKESKLRAFLKAFNNKPELSLLQKLDQDISTDDLSDLSRLAYWFCYFYENPLLHTDRIKVAYLFSSEQAEFISTAIKNNHFPREVYDQCKQIKNQEIKDNPRLAKKWDNMVCFASQIKKGMHYYYCTLDRNNRPSYALWSESKEDKRRFKKGLCFFSADAAKNWADGMI